MAALLCGAKGRFIMLVSLSNRRDVLAGAGEVHFREELGAVRLGGALHPSQHMGAAGVVIRQSVGNGIVHGAIAPEQLSKVPAPGVNVRVWIGEMALGKRNL